MRKSSDMDIPVIPDGLVEMLQDFTVAVLLDQPLHIFRFAAEYFAAAAADGDEGDVVSTF